MGILNVTPDSFSGDGLLAADDPVDPLPVATPVLATSTFNPFIYFIF